MLQRAVPSTSRVTRAYLQAAIFAALTCREFRRFGEKKLLSSSFVFPSAKLGRNRVGEVENFQISRRLLFFCEMPEMKDVDFLRLEQEAAGKREAIDNNDGIVTNNR